MGVPERHLPSAEAVTYQQIERMAMAASASGLFGGIKNKEQALTLMLLAQSEGIHPMTAMRDYHVIQGRPSLKADTMLARFHQAGGKVEWHLLTDQKCEATFTHASGGTAKIAWTFEMAKTAGLTSKDVWKFYPRAMLRSRTVSEGVRTVLPGVIAGLYTPEEIDSMSIPEIPETKEEKVASFDRPGLLQGIVDSWLGEISAAQDLKSLQEMYKGAMQEAREAKDELRIGTFTLAYDARKEELAAQKIEPVQS